MYRYLGKQLIESIRNCTTPSASSTSKARIWSKKIITIDPEAKEAFQRIKKEEETAKRSSSIR